MLINNSTIRGFGVLGFWGFGVVWRFCTVDIVVSYGPGWVEGRVGFW